MSSVLAIALSAAVLAMAALLYLVPVDAVGAMGLAPEGAERFQQALHVDVSQWRVSHAAFVIAFRALLGCQWAAWIALVARAFMGRLPHRTLVIAMPIVIVCLLAVTCPPVLSRDVFAYVAYGRLAFDHGLNPYVNDRAALLAAGDPAAGYLVWSSPLPYGPAWTMLATAIAALGPSAVAFAEAVGHKLLAGACLLAVAALGARLAEVRERERGVLTFIAIAFNPLLLIEGPGTGHNDLIMLAALAAAALCWARGQERWSGTLAGVAVAIKPVAIVAVPLMLLQDLAANAGFGRPGRLLSYLACAGGVPLALTFVFGGPFVVARAVMGQGAAPLGLTGQLIGTGLAVAVGIWSIRYLSRATGTYPAWFTAWVPCATLLILLGTRQWFPWYVSWLLVPSLIGWDERHRILTTGAVTCGVMLQFVYTLGV